MTKKKCSSRFYSLLLSFVFCLLSFFGCAPASYVKPPVKVAPAMPGIYHRVEKGQTLWRISKMYDVDLDEIARVNRIDDTAVIEVGQQIFIPNRLKPAAAIKYASEDFIWPVRGKIVCAFGQTFNQMINKGINIRPYGNSDILASRSGRVVFYAEHFGSFGRTVIIEHGDGFSTVYARNSKVFVKPGDAVRRGQLLAKVGSAGRDRNEYLHFEIRKKHVPQNPTFYLAY